MTFFVQLWSSSGYDLLLFLLCILIKGMIVALLLAYVVYIFFISKEEGATFNPTFSVSVIFGKRDEVILLML